jgi:hypothetical protein
MAEAQHILGKGSENALKLLLLYIRMTVLEELLSLICAASHASRIRGFRQVAFAGGREPKAKAGGTSPQAA